MARIVYRQGLPLTGYRIACEAALIRFYNQQHKFYWGIDSPNHQEDCKVEPQAAMDHSKNLPSWRDGPPRKT
jgi:hypothetical protein